MKLPNFSFEKKLVKKGYKFIAGVDEVGKGSFAGPLVTGCVVFNKQISKSANKQIVEGVARKRGAPKEISQDPDVIINDSKKMRPRQRESSAVWIKENALAWGIGEVSVGKINRLGMGKASKIAFRKAISEARKRLRKPIDYLLADAFFIPYVPGLPARRSRRRQLAIINGDEKSVSIAAASIIAKVYRDKLMTRLGKRPKYRKYGWGRNKGYGTKEHQSAIKKYGTTRLHRKQFVETWMTNLKS